MRARKALEEDRFRDAIVPVVIPGGTGSPDIIVDKDEHPRPDTIIEDLRRIQPASKEKGSVTAGTTSGLNNGASSVLVASKEMVDKLIIESQWRFMGSAAVGLDPKYMGIGSVFAISKLFDQTGYRIDFPSEIHGRLEEVKERKVPVHTTLLINGEFCAKVPILAARYRSI
jgi:acetyl-CoA C-acetyltransferase